MPGLIRPRSNQSIDKGDCQSHERERSQKSEGVIGASFPDSCGLLDSLLRERMQDIELLLDCRQARAELLNLCNRIPQSEAASAVIDQQ
jgi:hypothetical protein